jgi:hypothetical protein
MNGLKEIFGGIIDIFTGDFEKGFKKIGRGILRGLLAPFQGLLNMIGKIFNGVVGWINNIPGVSIDKFEMPNIADVTMGDDVVSPGYGKRTILSPEGSIALNDNDTIVAGTDLYKPKNPYGDNGSFSTDLSKSPYNNNTTITGTDLGESKSPSEGNILDKIIDANPLFSAVKTIFSGITNNEPSSSPIDAQALNMVINEIKAVKEAVLSITNQPVNINMDGEKVGEKAVYGTNTKNNKIASKMQ